MIENKSFGRGQLISMWCFGLRDRETQISSVFLNSEDTLPGEFDAITSQSLQKGLQKNAKLHSLRPILKTIRT